jgi:hypothetical protein
MTDANEKILEATIVKVEGTPNLPEQPEERPRWECFKSWLFPHMRKSKELAQAYTEAKVAKEENEARKIAEEAAEIAARKDLTMQQEASEFNALIDDIFADDGMPIGAKALKLAKLMEKNPQIVAQLDEVKGIMEELALKKGLNIEVEEDSIIFLPEEQDFETRQEAVAVQTEEISKKEAINEKLMTKIKMPIQELELSLRAYNCLKSVKVETVGELVMMTEADLLKIHRLGKTSQREIRRKLADIGLSLGMTDF